MSFEDAAAAVGVKTPPPPSPEEADRLATEAQARDIEELKARQNELYIRLRKEGALGTSIEHGIAENYKKKVGSYPDWYRPPGLMRSLFGNAEPEGY
jgi:hypothetical protein